MSLLLELGNTRLKASLLTKKSYEYLGSFSASWLEKESLVELLGIESVRLSRVFIASVGNAHLEYLLSSKVKTELEIFPHVIETQPECCGVLNGYDNYKQLGVDRWLAMIGACSKTSKPTLIIDAGTAITVDVVLEKKHLGGLIVPGLGLQHASLAKSTQKLSLTELSSLSHSDNLLGSNTASGIHGGCLYMTTAYINQLVGDLENETGRLFDCIGTGGDFLTLKPLLEKSFEYIEDLTLLGMAEIVKKV